MKNKKVCTNYLNKEEYFCTQKHGDSIFELLAEQGCRCAICKVPDKDFICDKCAIMEHGKELFVDFDPITKKARRLLCKKCMDSLLIR